MDILSSGWFPNSISGSSERIQDCYVRTAKLDVSSTADDLNSENHPYGAVFREVVKAGWLSQEGITFYFIMFIETSIEW